MPTLCVRTKKSFCENHLRLSLTSLAVVWLFPSSLTLAVPPTRPLVERPQGLIVGWGGEVFGGDLSSDVIAVVTGVSHALALKSDGSIVAWGYNRYGKSEVPDPNSGFVGISAGEYHSLGLKADGSVVSWGCQYYWCIECGHCWCNTMAPLPIPNAGFIQVISGLEYDYGLRADGSIVRWGGYWGYTEVLAENTGVVSLWGGGGGVLGLKEDGSVWSPDGALPNPNAGFVALAAGVNHALGLKVDGSIVSWGSNPYGATEVPEPNSNFVSVAAGRYHSLGVKSDGSVVSWGCQQVHCPCPPDCYYECGETPCYCSIEATTPSPNEGFVSVSSGVGVKSDGSVTRWGTGPMNGPVSNEGFVVVYPNQFALRSNGALASWGCPQSNNDGQCEIPEPNLGFIDFASNTSGVRLGVKSDGSILAWGCDSANQALCDVPLPNSDFVAVGLSRDHALGLKANGSMISWGANLHGEGDVPLPNADFVAIAAGAYHSLGLKSNGSIVEWGCEGLSQNERDYYGCDIVPPVNAGYVAIAANLIYSAAVSSTGVIDDFRGSRGIPAPNSNFVVVVTGLGLKSDGSIVGWGSNWFVAPDNPPLNVGFIGIASWSVGIRLEQGNFDGDGLVNLLDLNDFYLCFAGPDETPLAQRWRFLDLDDDFDVDLADFRMAQNSYTGS